MIGSLNDLFAATVFFVGAHFALSSHPLRRPLVRRLGASGFLTFYSLVVTAGLIWMIVAYREAPLVSVWTPVPALAWVPLAVMPVALFLVVAGVTTRNPTMVGAERTLAAARPERPGPGIISITRHPFLWGAALWAASHLAVNGELANITLMAGILVLSLGGMAHIDQRREDTLGAAWGPVKLTTSALPFAAILSRRTKLDWRGIGWWRPVLALGLYLVLLPLHAWLFGASPVPG